MQETFQVFVFVSKCSLNFVVAKLFTHRHMSLAFLCVESVSPADFNNTESNFHSHHILGVRETALHFI